MDTNPFFDKVCSRYDNYSCLANDSQMAQMLKVAMPEQNSRLVLDVATGTGNFGAIFVDKADMVVGLDINEGMLSEVKEKGLAPLLGDVDYHSPVAYLMSCYVANCFNISQTTK